MGIGLRNLNIRTRTVGPELVVGPERAVQVGPSLDAEHLGDRQLDVAVVLILEDRPEPALQSEKYEKPR